MRGGGRAAPAVVYRFLAALGMTSSGAGSGMESQDSEAAGGDGSEVRTGSEQGDLERDLRRARRRGLFESLARIYAAFPETTCEGCARCCFESPGVFCVEYLQLVEQLGRTARGRREELIRRALGELMFSWVEASRECVFLESSRCVLYEQRPLACRLFGVTRGADREEAEVEARMAAREEARRLGRLGIKVPEEVVARSLASCDRVRDREGRRVRVDGDLMAAKVARLDEALLPREVVVEEFCFRSLPERLGAAGLGRETVEVLRVQLLRRAQRGERIADLVEQVVEMARLPARLR